MRHAAEVTSISTGCAMIQNNQHRRLRGMTIGFEGMRRTAETCSREQFAAAMGRLAYGKTATASLLSSFDAGEFTKLNRDLSDLESLLTYAIAEARWIIAFHEEGKADRERTAERPEDRL